MSHWTEVNLIVKIALLLIRCHSLVWFLYLSAILSISFLTKGIFRSSWSVRLLTYHGESAIALSVFDWNLWMR
jgi:hypothetical protein